MGCWSEMHFLGQDQEWHVERIAHDSSHFAVYHQGKKAGEVQWNIVGQHNMNNALMAIAAAYHVGVQVKVLSSTMFFCQCETSFGSKR